MSKFGAKISVIVFLVFVYGVGIIYFKEVKNIGSMLTDSEQSVTEKIDCLNNVYNDNIFEHDKWIELYGATQRILGKQQIENFTYFKTSYGKLIETSSENSLEENERYADNVDSLYNYLNKKNIPMFYMTNILPVVDANDLPQGVSDYSRSNASELYNCIKSRGIPTINLRKGTKVNNIKKQDLFYKTDHHWSMKTCFASFQDTIKAINEELNLDLDSASKYTNLKYYKEWKKENCFLGSYGVKVGKLYAGEDDFVVYLPKFETELDFQMYQEHKLILEKTGSFEEAAVDFDILDNPNYVNKYNAFSNGGYIENRIINRMADNNLKVLLISHSYGRPLFPYLSLCFKETRNLDPQEGRYNDSYKKYINDYNPDIVLIFTELAGSYIPIPE